jgi:hypothetical protein
MAKAGLPNSAIASDPDGAQHSAMTGKPAGFAFDAGSRAVRIL